MNDRTKPSQLSDRGAARRDAMLGDLLEVLERTRRVRRGRRTGAAVLAIVLVAAGSLWMTGPFRDITPPDAAPSEAITVRVINDDELLKLLADMGRPTGLVRTGGRAWLTTQVTDEDLGIERQSSDS